MAVHLWRRSGAVDVEDTKPAHPRFAVVRIFKGTEAMADTARRKKRGIDRLRLLQIHMEAWIGFLPTQFGPFWGD